MEAPTLELEAPRMEMDVPTLEMDAPGVKLNARTLEIEGPVHTTTRAVGVNGVSLIVRCLGGRYLPLPPAGLLPRPPPDFPPVVLGPFAGRPPPPLLPPFPPPPLLAMIDSLT